jgi:hypothetical protein
MAIKKNLVKLNHIDSVVKILNDVETADTVTVTLQTDLLKSNETLTVGKSPKVAISSIEWSVNTSTGYIVIVRNGKVIQRLYGTGEMTNAFSADHEEEDSDIQVTMTGGTAYIRLLKVQGYTPTFQPEQHGGE